MRSRAGFGTALAAIVSVVLAASAGGAWAAGIETLPAVGLRITSDLGIDRTFDAAGMGCAGGAGYTGYSVSCNGYDYDLGGAELSSLNVNFVVDPEVHLNISLINTSANAQTFTLETTLPTVFTGTNRMGGSVGGSLTETNGGTASLTSAAIYSALIDDIVVQTLLPSYSLSVPNAFETGIVGPSAFGQPIPNAPAPSVEESIGIRLSFRLSPGDQVALSSVFVVQTPEPATAGLLGLAALALVALRRRGA